MRKNRHALVILDLPHLFFEFVSDFVLRASDLSCA